MRVTVIQMTPSQVVEENVAQARDLIARACRSDRSDLVVLPEVWSCLGGDDQAKRAAAERLPDPETIAGPLYRAMSDIAREHGIVLHGGSIGETAGEHLYNTTLAFDPKGVELARYRKIHLFDVDVPGGTAYRESDTYRAGRGLATYRADGITVGCAICYDLRFAYLFEALRSAGAELVLLPAAFTSETGRAHWDVLVRARAIEFQSWIAAAATTGRHLDASGGQRSTFGHSMICDPWGTVVARASDGPGWATARIDQTVTERVRRDMPVWTHRISL